MSGRAWSAVVVVLLAIGVFAMAMGGCGGSSGSATRTVRFLGGDAIPAKPAAPIRLTDYRGHEVDLAALKGKPVLVAFLYTHCTDLCPIVASKVHTAYSLLGAHEARPVFLAVSVDPAHDTPASAAKFNREHRTSGEIDWLLGSHAELARVWRAWHIVPERKPNDPEVIEHSADIYGVGADGKVHVLYSPQFRPALLALDVQALASF